MITIAVSDDMYRWLRAEYGLEMEVAEAMIQNLMAQSVLLLRPNDSESSPGSQLGLFDALLAKSDAEEIPLTPRFVAALKELMAAECEMMSLYSPESAPAWTWGRCQISDLAIEGGVVFNYGGSDDRPSDNLGDFGVISLGYGQV